MKSQCMPESSSGYSVSACSSQAQQNFARERSRTVELIPKLKSKFARTLHECEHMLVLSTAASSQTFGRDLKSVSITVGSHGNEFGGTAALNEFIEELLQTSLPSQFRLAFGFGNLAAAYEDKRYLDRDLDRCFDESGNQRERTREDAIAAVYKKHLLFSQVHLDVHQTIGPSRSAFFIGPDLLKSQTLAASLHPMLPMVCFPLGAFSSDGVTLDDFLNGHGVASVSVELGQKGFDPDQIQLGKKLMWSLVDFGLLTQASQNEPNAELLSVIEKRTLHSHYTLKRKLFPNYQLVPGLKNLDPIARGDLLAFSAESQFHAPVDGFVLFPKYGESANNSSELCQILVSSKQSAGD